MQPRAYIAVCLHRKFYTDDYPRMKTYSFYPQEMLVLKNHLHVRFLLRQSAEQCDFK